MPYVHLSHYISEVLLEEQFFQIKVVQKIKTHISCSITFSRKSCRLLQCGSNMTGTNCDLFTHKSSGSYLNHLVYNVETYGGAKEAADDNTIRRMCFTCWITKTTETHSEYVILIAFPRQQLLSERACRFCCVASLTASFLTLLFQLSLVFLYSYSLMNCRPVAPSLLNIFPLLIFTATPCHILFRSSRWRSFLATLRFESFSNKRFRNVCIVKVSTCLSCWTAFTEEQLRHCCYTV